MGGLFFDDEDGETYDKCNAVNDYGGNEFRSALPKGVCHLIGKESINLQCRIEKLFKSLR